MNDGFAYAAGSPHGTLHRFPGRTIAASLLGDVVWAGSTLISVLFVGIPHLVARPVGHFHQGRTPDAAQAVRRRVITSSGSSSSRWPAPCPFIMDGIMVGATETKVMRNSMLLSTVAYFGIFYSLYPSSGTTLFGWPSRSICSCAARCNLLMTRRLRLIYRKAAA